MTKDEFFAKWDEQTLNSQDACNPSGLLHSTCELLSDWRDAGGEFSGKDCPHLKLLMYQMIFLVFGHEMMWRGWHDAYGEIKKRLEEREVSNV